MRVRVALVLGMAQEIAVPDQLEAGRLDLLGDQRLVGTVQCACTTVMPAPGCADQSPMMK